MQEGSTTLIANNTFVRVVSEDDYARAIELRSSASDEPAAVATIEYNTISGFDDGDDIGIRVYGRNVDATITGNTIMDNDTGIWITDDQAPASIHQNCIAGNSLGLSGLFANVDARENWWGDPSGSRLSTEPRRRRR